MRILIPIITIAVSVAVLVLVMALMDRRDARRRGVTDTELRRLAQQMARQLDKGLADPMLRVSPDWERTSQALVDRFYGRELR